MTTAINLCPMCSIESIDDEPDHGSHDHLMAEATPGELAHLDRVAAACHALDQRDRSHVEEWVRTAQPIIAALIRRREAHAQAARLASLRAEVATFLDVKALTPQHARLIVDYCRAAGLVGLDQPSY